MPFDTSHPDSFNHECRALQHRFPSRLVLNPVLIKFAIELKLSILCLHALAQIYFLLMTCHIQQSAETVYAIMSSAYLQFLDL